MDVPAVLRSLSDREAMVDALYRCTTAMDLKRPDLFSSAFFADATFNLHSKPLLGLSAITEQCYSSLLHLDTTHMLGNMRIQQLSDGKSAQVSCTGVAHHYRQGKGMEEEGFAVGSLNDVSLALDEDSELWKVRRWDLRIIWTAGNQEIMAGGKSVVSAK